MSKLALKGGEPVRRQPFPQWPSFDEKEENAVLSVLRSGIWGIGGERISEFSEKFAALHECAYGICVSSGTVALQLALLAAGIKPGDEVIVPAYTFVATASAVLSVNAMPVFADINPETYTVEPGDIVRKITQKTRAIIPVHLAGHPADVTEITRIAQQHDLILIADCAQAHLAEWQNSSVAVSADLACFSFQSSKNMTCGEGGIILTNDECLADKCWSYHNCGRTRDGVWYHHPYLGGNYRMTELQAAILLVQMEKLEQQTELRMRNAAYLSERLAAIEGIEPLVHDERVTRHAFHLYIFKFCSAGFNGVDRSHFIEALNAEGIPAVSGYVPLYKEGFLQDALLGKAIRKTENSGFLQSICPETEKACYQEAVWLTQNLLLGNQQDMDSIGTAIARIGDNAAELV